MNPNTPNQQPVPPSARNRKPRLPPWAFALLCILGSAAVTVGMFESVLLTDIPILMLGKWMVVEGEHEGTTMEFFRDGTMIGTIKKDGKEGIVKWKVTMTGEGFRVTTGGEFGGVQVTEEHAILELTDRQFIFQDGQGEVLNLTRVRSPGFSAEGN